MFPSKMTLKPLAFAIPIGTILALTLAIKLWTSRKRQAKVSRLIVYPVKSLPGIEVDQLEIVETGARYGPVHDRSFVLLNEANNIVTQRTKPKLSLLKLTLHGDELWITGPGMERTLKVSLEPFSGKEDELIHFIIWSKPSSGWEFGAEATEWFSEYLNGPTRLIAFATGALHRTTSVQVSTTEVSASDKDLILYQDGAPLLIINEESVRDLNSRLSRSDRVTYVNFRPNILIANVPAYQEDRFGEIEIGSNKVKLSNVKPCDRCTFTTVIPSKGIKSPNQEPLKTLKSYRIKEELKHLYKESPLFGINLTVLDKGVIRVNDELKF